MKELSIVTHQCQKVLVFDINVPQRMQQQSMSRTVWSLEDRLLEALAG
jgi:hypothetical protein